MGDILSTAASFIFLIALSYFLKRKGIFKSEDKRFLSGILINICLPCVIINGFSDFNFDLSLFTAVFLCIVISSSAAFVAYLVSRKKERDITVLHMMSSTGYNIGIFTIPFVSSFLSSTAVVCTLMFDMGNAIFVFGTLAAMTSFAVDKETSNPIPALLKRLFTTVPFLVYFIMLAILALDITLPNIFYTFVDLGANSTSFLAMILIGIMLEFHFKKEEIKEIISALVVRYSISFISSIVIFMSPIFDHEIKKALMIALFSPISTASVVFLQRLKCKSSLVGAVSSLSIMISIVIIISIVIFV